MVPSDARAGLNRLEEWLKVRGWRVVSGSQLSDEVDFDQKTVFSCSRGKREHVLYSMLHECGHILAGGKKAVLALLDVSHQKKQTLTHRVAVAVNESRAWDAGDRLAHRLRIPFDRRAYEQYRALFLGKYFAWAGRKKKSELKHT